MSALRFRSFAAWLTILVALALGACSVLNDYEPVAASGGGGNGGGSDGGATSTGGTSGAGGELPTCNDAACEGGSSECTTCTCLQGLVCDCDPLTMGAPCSEGVCDGQGHCVDCLQTADCPTNVICDGITCVDGGCTDSDMNNQETDVDCGGADCAPCPVGGSCLVPEDCATIHCDRGVCLPCAEQGDCGASLYCVPSSGTCMPQKEKFFPCANDYECISGVCGEFGTLMVCN